MIVMPNRNSTLNGNRGDEAISRGSDTVTLGATRSVNFCGGDEEFHWHRIAQSGLHHVFQIGGALDEAPPNLGGGFYIEAGFMASRVPSNTAFASFNYMSAWHFGESNAIRDRSGRVIGWTDRDWKALPFVTAGYTRLFSVGNAFNFGGGVDYRFNNTTALRFEVRSRGRAVLHLGLGRREGHEIRNGGPPPACEAA